MRLRVGFRGLIFGLLLSGLFAPYPVNAVVTIDNFRTDALGTRRAMRLDVNGNMLRGHDGQLTQDPLDPTRFVLIGTDYDCGRRWQWSAYPFCGFVAHTSKSLKSGEWSAPISLFDASGSTWQTRCVPYGCYRPHLIYCASCAADAKFKLWVNITSGGDYVVLKAATITGPYTEVGVRNLNGAGDFDLIMRADGNGYLAYTFYQNNWDIWIVKLNATLDDVTGTHKLLVDGTGPHSSTSTTYEAPTLFERSGRLFITYSHTCGYCPGTAPIVLYTDSTDPITATWNTGATLNSNSCGGQPLGVAKINDGADKWLFISDLWKAQNDGLGNTQLTPPNSHGQFGWANQARGDLFMVPLTFDGSNLPQPFTCVENFTLDLAPDPPAPPANLTLNSVSTTMWHFCDVRDTVWRYQTFTPTRTGAHTLKLALFKGVIDGTVCEATNGGNCPAVDQNLRVLIVQHGSGAPGTTLATVDIPHATISSSPKLYDVTTPSLTAGTKYGYVLRSAANVPANSCFGTGFSNFNVVDNGEHYFTGNSGGAWALDGNPGSEGQRDVMFQLIGPPATDLIMRVAPGYTLTVKP